MTAWRGTSSPRITGARSTRPTASCCSSSRPPTPPPTHSPTIAKLDPPLQARAGLHVGEVILTENSLADVALGAKPLAVEGLAKPVAARVMALALARQTLLTSEAADALTLRRTHAGPDGAIPGSGEPVLLAHGHWMLKGVLAPVPLFEVGVPRRPMIPPSDTAKAWRVAWRNKAWMPAREVKHGLPRERRRSPPPPRTRTVPEASGDGSRGSRTRRTPPGMVPRESGERSLAAVHGDGHDVVAAVLPDPGGECLRDGVALSEHDAR